MWASRLNKVTKKPVLEHFPGECERFGPHPPDSCRCRWNSPARLGMLAAMSETTQPIPPLESRFLEPEGFVWGTFTNTHGQALRWGCYARPGADKTCVLVGGFTEFIEKYFETAQDFAARGFAVWCMDWLGQGGSARPATHPTRPRARDCDADAD